MKNGYKIGLAAIVASLALVGCGGGSSSSSSTPSTVTGQFIDGPVAGLNYTCTTAPAGVTDSMGYYTCNTGDTVTFSVGDYVIGSTQASEGIVTPSDIATEENEVSNIAVLLQSLDTNTTDGDIITLDGNFTSTVDLNSTSEEFENEIVAEDNGITSETIVDADTAVTNMQESELRTLLGGKTFYEVGTDDSLDVIVYLDSWVISDFIENEANSTWTELMHAADGIADATGEDTLIISTNGQLVTTIELVGEDGVHTLAYNKDASTDTYLAFDVTNSPDGPFQLKLYFELADAEAYYDSLLPSELELLIVGKTHYFVTSEGVTGQRSYETDGTFTANITLVDGQVRDTSGTYTIENDVITINRTSPNTLETVLTYTGEESGGLGFTGSIDGGDEFQTVSFYTEAELDAYLASLSATLESLLAGKTVYTTIYDQMGTLESWAFNAEMTSVTWTEVEGGTDTDTETLSVYGMTMITNADTAEPSTIVVTEILEDYLLMSIEGGDAQRLYFDEAMARAYFLDPTTPTSIAITQSMLDGETFYHIEEDRNYLNEVVETIHATMTLSAKTLTRSEFIQVYEGDVVVDSFTDDFTVPYEIIDGKVRVDVPAWTGESPDEYEPAAYIWWTLTSENTDSWTLIDEEDENKDGSIEFTENITLYLSEPTDWPTPPAP